MHIDPEVLKLDEPAKAIEQVGSFLRDYVEKASVNGVVLGMSGGLDSSVVAALCSKAFKDHNKVLGLCMPEEETHISKNIQDAKRVAEIFNIEFKVVDVTPMIRSYFNNLNVFDPRNRVANGNLKARVRAITLYYHSNIQNRLVVGTTDKSEMMLG